MSNPLIAREPANLTTVRNHWWWRPGWKEGRHFYACHLTFEDQPQLQRLVHTYQHTIQNLDSLDPIPQQWLHLTMQGIGFLDEISEEEIKTAKESLIQYLGEIAQPIVTFQHPTIQKEALYLRAEPKEALFELRMCMYRAVVSVLGPDRLSDPEPTLETFGPHVSFAYVNAETPASALEPVLQEVQANPVTVTFSQASLLEFHRDNRMYEWPHATPIPIGPSRSA